jgi:hypothetical protein
LRARRRGKGDEVLDAADFGKAIGIGNGCISVLGKERDNEEGETLKR